MGKEIAKEAFGSVMKVLAAQIKNMAVVPVNILASVTKVTVATPGGREDPGVTYPCPFCNVPESMS